MVNYKKLRKGKENKVYNIDRLEWTIKEYQQRVDRKVKAVVIDDKPLTKRDKVKFVCEVCGKSVELFSDKFAKRSGEKFCRECAITKYHERNPDWLSLTDEQKQSISERNSGPKIIDKEARVCPVCGKEFEVRLTSHNMKKRYCSKECNIVNWGKYGEMNGGGYAHLGIKALLGRDTMPEIKMKKLLEDNSISFEHQKRKRIHNDKMRVFDFWLPDYNTFIEVDGDYWHYNKNNSRITKKPPTQKQVSKMVHDQEKNEYCEKEGIQLIRIWESELDEKADEILKQLTTKNS